MLFLEIKLVNIWVLWCICVGCLIILWFKIMVLVVISYICCSIGRLGYNSLDLFLFRVVMGILVVKLVWKMRLFGCFLCVVFMLFVLCCVLCLWLFVLFMLKEDFFFLRFSIFCFFFGFGFIGCLWRIDLY